MKHKLQVTADKITALESLSSGSGLVLQGDSVYIISDNAPAYYKLDLLTNGYRTLPIEGYPQNVIPIAKKVKHDLESAVTGTMNGREYLFAFGSGSMTNREMLLVIDLEHKEAERQIPLHRLYAELRNRYRLSHEALNIEGAAMCNGRLYLFLRKKNLIISFNWAEFCQFLSAPLENALPPSDEQFVRLPKLAGIAAGFSGAGEIVYKGKEAMLFCASLEDTPNAIDDGPVSGSYIGILSTKSKRLKIEGVGLLKDKNGHILREKIESIIALESTESGYRCLLVSDNDNGFSKLFEVNIRLED